jgi:UDP-glucose 4-epimerase
MRILVTGGAGFIGSHITDAFIEDGHHVWVIDDLSTGHRENVNKKATFVEGDIRNAETVNALFEKARPEIVCHQAAQTSVSVSTREPIRDADINVLGSVHLLQAAVNHKVARFLFASTGGAIYGEVAAGSRATTEWWPKPLSPYACSKLAFEGYLRCYQHEHGLEYTILRYANVYGPRQDPHGEAGVVAIFSERLGRGEPIRVNAMRETGDPGCIRDYVYVADVVEANRKAVRGEISARIANVCTGVEATTLDLARRLESSLGVKAEIGFAARRPGDLERSVLDPTGGPITSPVSLADGLEKTAAWFRERMT